MSRTDVHRPWSVQVQDPYNRHRLRRWHSWATDPEVSYLPLYGACGCNMCTGRLWHRQSQRQVRVLWRNTRQELLKTTPEDREDMDVPPLHGSGYYG